MTKRLFVLMALLVGTAAIAAVEVVPKFGYFRQNYTGAIVSFIAGSGTNTTIEAIYDKEVPWRLAEVTSTSTSTLVYRVWQYDRPNIITYVETNFFGTVQTNQYLAGAVTATYTNLVYDSAADTLPDNEHFIQGDKMIVSFGADTNAVVRILGTVQ